MRYGAGKEAVKDERTMNQQIKSGTVAALAAVLAACVSVPRDAGVSDVGRAVAERGGPSVEWRTQPAIADDDRIASLLADELTADEAVALATINSPRLQVALAELGIARADLIEMSTIANPIAELEIRFPGEPYRPYEVRIAQALVDLMQLPRRRALGRAVFEVAQLGIVTEVLRFAGEVRSSYFDLIAANQRVALNRTIAEAAQTAAEVAIRQHRAENITDLDLENEQAQYEQTKLELARSERALLLAREALMRAMGLRNAALEWRVPSSFPPLPESETDQQEIERLASAQRLDIALARRELEVAQRRVPLSRLSALEEMAIDYHYEREPGGERTQGPGIEIPIPIFNTGRAARSRAEAEYLRARHALNALETEAASLLRAARASLSEARARVEYYRDVIVPRRARIVELTKLEHNAMLAGIFQLLQAKQNDLQARRDFIDAQREYWAARTNLDRAIQGIAEEAEFLPATERRNGRETVRGEDH